MFGVPPIIRENPPFDTPLQPQYRSQWRIFLVINSYFMLFIRTLLPWDGLLLLIVLQCHPWKSIIAVICSCLCDTFHLCVLFVVSILLL